MKENIDDILEKAARRDGMLTPEGYFEDFARRMEASLPVQPWETEMRDIREGRVMPAGFWQKVRPYVYLAAMFAGVWCMMNMFDMIRSSGDVTIPGNNAILAEAIADDSFISDYCMDGMEPDDLYNDLYEEGFQPASLKNF